MGTFAKQAVSLQPLLAGAERVMAHPMGQMAKSMLVRGGVGAGAGVAFNPDDPLRGAGQGALAGAGSSVGQYFGRKYALPAALRDAGGAANHWARGQGGVTGAVVGGGLGYALKPSLEYVTQLKGETPSAVPLKPGQTPAEAQAERMKGMGYMTPETSGHLKALGIALATAGGAYGLGRLFGAAKPPEELDTLQGRADEPGRDYVVKASAEAIGEPSSSPLNAAIGGLPYLLPLLVATAPFAARKGWVDARSSNVHRVETKTEKAKREFEEALKSEYARSKTASAGGLIDLLAKEHVKTAQDGDPSEARTGALLGGGYLALATLLGIAGYRATKSFFESRDPARAKLTAAKEMIKRRQAASHIPIYAE